MRRRVFGSGRAGSVVADMGKWMAGLGLKELDYWYSMHSQVPYSHICAGFS
jgi:hypothetical protein